MLSLIELLWLRSPKSSTPHPRKLWRDCAAACTAALPVRRVVAATDAQDLQLLETLHEFERRLAREDAGLPASLERHLGTNSSRLLDVLQGRFKTNHP